VRVSDVQLGTGDWGLGTRDGPRTKNGPGTKHQGQRTKSLQSDSDRDRTVERLLRQSLKARAGSVAHGPCLDAETIAAWADEALAGEELVAAEAHASDCSRCQAMLAAIARTTASAAVHNAREDGAPAFQASGPAKTRWRSGWRIGWLVPLTAAAAALVLWIVVPRDEARRSVEQAPARARADAPSSPKARESQRPESPALGGGKPASILAAGKAQAPADQGRGQTRNKAEDATRAEAARPLEKGVGLDADRAASDTARRETDAVTSPGQAPLERRPTDALAERRAQAFAPGPPAAVTPVIGGANAVTPARETATMAASRASPLEILSPDRSSRWRPGAGGAVEYSSDGGATWQPLATGVSADLTAGASPSASVCWLVGRAGTVVLSTDGRRWQRVTFPEAADLTAVSATDARTATVTTADGRRFSTTDGGLTWRQP